MIPESLKFIYAIISQVSIGLGIIWIVWRITKDVRTNFQRRVDEKCDQGTVDLIKENTERSIKGIHGRISDMHKHFDKRFDDLKDLIKANGK